MSKRYDLLSVARRAVSERFGPRHRRGDVEHVVLTRWGRVAKDVDVYRASTEDNNLLTWVAIDQATNVVVILNDPSHTPRNEERIPPRFTMNVVQQARADHPNVDEARVILTRHDEATEPTDEAEERRRRMVDLAEEGLTKILPTLQPEGADQPFGTLLRPVYSADDTVLYRGLVNGTEVWVGIDVERSLAMIPDADRLHAGLRQTIPNVGDLARLITQAHEELIAGGVYEDDEPGTVTPYVIGWLAGRLARFIAGAPITKPEAKKAETTFRDVPGDREDADRPKVNLRSGARLRIAVTDDALVVLDEASHTVHRITGADVHTVTSPDATDQALFPEVFPTVVHRASIVGYEHGLVIIHVTLARGDLKVDGVATVTPAGRGTFVDNHGAVIALGDHQPMHVGNRRLADWVIDGLAEAVAEVLKDENDEG